jgi:uncharacterized protein YcsI (UPF0317 family)
MTSAAHEVRLRCRSGELNTPTSSLAPGHIQANLLILQSAAAADFHNLCLRNPVPCPLLAISAAPGNFSALSDPSLITTPDFDIRTDVPLYNVYREGKLIDTKSDILQEWTPDHVAFLLGCSFSFESALSHAGLTPRHWEARSNVPMYKTTRKLNPAGIFSGSSYVVSMRPYLPRDVERVRSVTRPFGRCHGEPIAWGWEAVRELGIMDLGRPEFGDAVEVRDGEVPVFWVSCFFFRERR